VLYWAEGHLNRNQTLYAVLNYVTICNITDWVSFDSLPKCKWREWTYIHSLIGDNKMNTDTWKSTRIPAEFYSCHVCLFSLCPSSINTDHWRFRDIYRPITKLLNRRHENQYQVACNWILNSYSSCSTKHKLVRIICLLVACYFVRVWNLVSPTMNRGWGSSRVGSRGRYLGLEGESNKKM
jgi:hypothetical protein